MAERIEPRKFLPDSTRQVPLVFQDLRPEDYFQLVNLTEEYFSNTRKGCLTILANFNSNNAAKMARRIDQISTISGIRDRETISIILANVGIITIRSRTKEEAYLALKERYDIVTKGKTLTLAENPKLAKYLRYSGLAVEIAMEKKIERMNRKAASKKRG